MPGHLSARGLSYTAVGLRNNFDVEGPGLFASGWMDVRLTDRSVILVRTDELTNGDFTLSNVQDEDFAANSVVNTIAGPVTVLGGWASVDVYVRGRGFRFVTTHLDPISADIRAEQATELSQGPGNTSLPLIFTGDFNSDSSAAAYANFTGAGFIDSWVQKHPLDPGFTCCQVPPDTIINPVSNLSSRVDLVLNRGGVRVLSIETVGATPASRTASGLWPSDHAGLAATLKLP